MRHSRVILLFLAVSSIVSCSHVTVEPFWVELTESIEHDVIFEFDEIDAGLARIVRDWLRREYGDSFDGSVADYGEPYFLSVTLDDLPTVQHQFTGDFTNFQILFLVTPDVYTNEPSALLVLYRKLDGLTCARWAGPLVFKMGAPRSVQEIIEAMWHSLEFESHGGKDEDCLSLNEVTVHWRPPW